MANDRHDNPAGARKGHCPIGDLAFLIPRMILGKVVETLSVLHESGISEHIAYDMQLDTISVIEANISKHPCSHGSMIRSYVSSHIIPSLMTGKEHRSVAAAELGCRLQRLAYSPMYHHPHHPHYPQKRNKRSRVSQSHSRRLNEPGHHSPD
jgi:hypothetical protein